MVCASPISICGRLSDGAPYHKQGDQPDRKEHKEQNLRDSYGGARNPREPQKTGDDGNN